MFQVRTKENLLCQLLKKLLWTLWQSRMMRKHSSSNSILVLFLRGHAVEIILLRLKLLPFKLNMLVTWQLTFYCLLLWPFWIEGVGRVAKRSRGELAENWAHFWTTLYYFFSSQMDNRVNFKQSYIHFKIEKNLLYTLQFIV